MKFSTKIKKSLWVLFSFIPFINGFGFIYIGIKANNKNWVIEGLFYEIPWLFAFIYVFDKDLCMIVLFFAILLLIISIVRSILIAKRLMKAYELEETSNSNSNSRINNSKDVNNNQKDTNQNTNENNNQTNQDNNENSFSQDSSNKSNNSANESKSNQNKKYSDNGDAWKGCCICLFGIFIILGIISIL